MSLQEAFAPPHVEIIGDEEVQFPLMGMDDWAACCNQLKANRRQELEKKLVTNQGISAAEREEILSRADRELIPMAYACSYRTETPAGIKSTLIKSLVMSGKTETEAKAIVAKIPPVRQQRIAKAIADPPIQVDQKKKEPEAPSEQQNEIGISTPDSSENTGASTLDA